ncbi:pyrroline-5-carboxylate reductase [Rhizobium sp. L1K21]|uniref:pyrroline-5-carboxylate reductase n=1 Tax=Rhizobium sp. L1K21 TaxID=2954933 RepID=UPI002093F9CB|nr:pyrroline-5-carboxylate reductase [Rhizobium sp. L1K21]MCO6185476.1 pyrroline-5-carboxylate reductase [Rhizobium sp. L1K21]
MTVSPTSPLVLIGAGNMGGAMLSGWLKSGLEGGSVLVIDPGVSPHMAELCAAHGVRVEKAAPEGLKAGILFLAVKPQMMETVLPPLKGLVGSDTVIVSVAAGKTLAFLETHLGKAGMVRAMPNTPAMVGRGITGAFATPDITDAQRAEVHDLLKVSGPVEWVGTEGEIDAVTAVSGSGPAYVFYLVECMAEAGRKAGLQADLAMRLARETVSGAGEMLYQSPETASKLRENVTSPGGTTFAALQVLMAEEGMQPLFDAAIAAAKARAQELAD